MERTGLLGEPDKKMLDATMNPTLLGVWRWNDKIQTPPERPFLVSMPRNLSQSSTPPTYAGQRYLNHALAGIPPRLVSKAVELSPLTPTSLLTISGRCSARRLAPPPRKALVVWGFGSAMLPTRLRFSMLRTQGGSGEVASGGLGGGVSGGV